MFETYEALQELGDLISDDLKIKVNIIILIELIIELKCLNFFKIIKKNFNAPLSQQFSFRYHSSRQVSIFDSCTYCNLWQFEFCQFGLVEFVKLCSVHDFIVKNFKSYDYFLKLVKLLK